MYECTPVELYDPDTGQAEVDDMEIRPEKATPEEVGALSEQSFTHIDNTLVELARSGNPQAIDTLGRQALKVTMWYARRYMNSLTDGTSPEDIAMTALESVFKKLPTLNTRPDVSFSSYLCRAVRNKAIDHHRRMAVRPSVAMDPNILAEAITASTFAADVEAEVEAIQKDGNLLRYIAQLREPVRKVAYLRLIIGANWGQTRSMLGLAKSTMHKYEHEAFDFLGIDLPQVGRAGHRKK